MSPTALNWMLFLHVLAALWLAGGVFAGAVVRAQGRKAATLGERALALRIAWRLANVYNLPGAIVAGILGFGLLHPLGLGFRPGWVQASIAVWLARAAERPVLPPPRAAQTPCRSRGLGCRRGAFAGIHPARRRQGPRIAADLNALGLVLLTLLMVIKPF